MHGEHFDEGSEGFLRFGGVERGASAVFVQVAAPVAEENGADPEFETRIDGPNGSKSPGIDLPVAVPIPRQRLRIFQELVPGGWRLARIQTRFLIQVSIVEEGHRHEIARNRVIGTFVLHHLQSLGIPGFEELVATLFLNEGGEIVEKVSLDEGTE